MSEEKKNHPGHKYSVTFVSKVGTKKPTPSPNIPLLSYRKLEQLASKVDRVLSTTHREC